MPFRVCCYLLLAVVTGEAAAELGAELIGAVLSNDECTAPGAACSLNALQRRRDVTSAGLKVASNSSEQEECEAAAELCADYMTYGLASDCDADEACRSLDAGDYGSPKASAWYCAPKDDTCDKYLDLNPNDFQPSEEIPEEYEDAPNDTAHLDGLLPGSALAKRCSTCARHSCYGYVRGNPCQCNSRCTRYHNCCSDYYARCAARHAHGHVAAGSGGAVGGPVMALYHTTSPGIANLIMRSNFRPGRSGWCGGAIYFINQPHLPKSKYAAGITKAGAIIQAKVRMGKIANMDQQCRGFGGKGTHAAAHAGYNSITFNPGDGAEFLVWHSSQVISKRRYQ